MKMKIAYFFGAMNRGGLESLILDISRQHKSMPYDFVCVYRHEGNMSDDFKKTGANYIHVPRKRGYLQYLWTLRRAFKREKVTIVHSQTPSNTILLSVALLCTGIKIITTFHGHLFADSSWWKRKLVYLVSKRIICVSNYQKNYYAQKWHLPQDNKLSVVYNGIDFTKLASTKNEENRDGESDRSKLAMVGNFIKGRSQSVIVKAIHLLKEKGVVNFDFYFVGRRDELEARRYDDCVRYCEEHHLKNAHFLGSRNDVPELLQTMDGFVYSTAHDTFGIAVIEAIAAGIPVVVNDWPVMTEVCNLGLPETNSAIRFFKTDDVEDCADKMKELLSDITTNKKQIQADCKQASDTVRLKYSIQTHINNLYSIYQSL